MASLDSILNFLIPALLILIALGFVWVKMIEPWVMPMLTKLWESLKNKSEARQTGKKEITYE